MVSHFKVQLRVDGAREANVEIDRGRSLLTVRPARRRTSYALPLSTVADLVVWRCLRSMDPPKRRRRARKAIGFVPTLWERP